MIKSHLEIKCNKSFRNKLVKNLGDQSLQDYLEWCMLHANEVIELQNHVRFMENMSHQDSNNNQTEFKLEELNLDWSDDYCVNIKEFDKDHRFLLSLTRRFFSALAQSKVHEIAIRILDNLIDYSQYHFSKEEILLSETDYPKLQEHKEEHDILRKKVLDLRERYNNKEETVIPDMKELLDQWLHIHIMKHDLAYKEHLNSRGYY